MAGVLVKMLKVHGQKAGLAAQWLVEIKSWLHEKEPDSREVFGRALNAVFSWLVALEIGWLTKKLEGLENIYYHITIDHSSSPMERSSSSSPKKVGQLPNGKEQFLPNTTRTLFTFYPKDSAATLPKVAKSFQFQLWLRVKLPLQGGLWGTEFQDRVVWIGHFMGGNLPLEFLEEVHQLTVWETGVNLPETPDLSLRLIFYI